MQPISSKIQIQYAKVIVITLNHGSAQLVHLGEDRPPLLVSPHLKIISMFAMVLALDAFHSPVRAMQLRQRRATSLCVQAVDILKFTIIRVRSLLQKSNSCLRDNVSNGAVVLPPLELQVRRVRLQGGISRPADETSRPVCFAI